MDFLTHVVACLRLTNLEHGICERASDQCRVIEASSGAHNDSTCCSMLPVEDGRIRASEREKRIDREAFCASDLALMMSNRMFSFVFFSFFFQLVTILDVTSLRRHRRVSTECAARRCFDVGSKACAFSFFPKLQGKALND